MPWKECHVMDERLRFVARLLEGEKMAPLCAEFGISRKTGYKIFDRYKDCGAEAFSDRSHRAHRQANRLPAPIEATIVRLKREYPGWGAPKIREKLRQQFNGPHVPATSTVHAVLDRHGLVHHRRRRRSRATGTELSRPTQPNVLWCADYKGEFQLGNRKYCYPLTITDFASRYLLTCEALLTTQEKFAFTVFERTFKEFGLPQVIRTDNGVPFASAHAIYGLSKLAQVRLVLLPLWLPNRLFQQGERFFLGPQIPADSVLAPQERGTPLSLLRIGLPCHLHHGFVGDP